MSEREHERDSQEISDHLLYLVNRGFLIDNDNLLSYLVGTTAYSFTCFTLLVIVFSLVAALSYLVVIIKN